jgi:hypothetical protein
MKLVHVSLYLRHADFLCVYLSDGPNCNPLGNVLIIQEAGADCPDDDEDGGMLQSV